MNPQVAAEVEVAEVEPMDHHPNARDFRCHQRFLFQSKLRNSIIMAFQKTKVYPTGRFIDRMAKAIREDPSYEGDGRECFFDHDYAMRIEKNFWKVKK